MPKIVNELQEVLRTLKDVINDVHELDLKLERQKKNTASILGVLEKYGMIEKDPSRGKNEYRLIPNLTHEVVHDLGVQSSISDQKKTEEKIDG